MRKDCFQKDPRVDPRSRSASRSAVKSFTLLEVIIAVFLLTIGLVGIFAVISKTLVYMAVSPDKLIATYLAQEGIEIVRNIRDTNWVRALGDWNEDLPAGYWQADYTTTSFSRDCGINYNCKSFPQSSPEYFLKIDGSGFYNYKEGTNTSRFARKITISYPEDPETYIIKVVATVLWAEKGKSYEISAEENLYDWH